VAKERFGKRKKQGQETKNRIMECATSLFRDKGYHNVTVDEIIEEADSSKGGFYNHFKSKEELLLNMLTLLDERYAEYLDEAEPETNALEDILSFIEHVLITIDTFIGLDFISVIYSSQIKDAAFPNFSITPQRVYYRALVSFIEEGKANNFFKKGVPTDQMIRFITTAVRGVIYDWCLYRGSFDLADYGKEVVTVVLHNLSVTSNDQN